jgi:hypothetical protein
LLQAISPEKGRRLLAAIQGQSEPNMGDTKRNSEIPFQKRLYCLWRYGIIFLNGRSSFEEVGNACKRDRKAGGFLCRHWSKPVKYNAACMIL